MKTLVAAAGAVGLSLAASASLASAIGGGAGLPAATVSGTADVILTYYNDGTPSGWDYGYSLGGPGSIWAPFPDVQYPDFPYASLDIEVEPLPALSATVAAYGVSDGSFSSSANVTAGITYDFEIFGPSGLVDLGVSTTLSTDNSGSESFGYSEAVITWWDPSENGYNGFGYSAASNDGNGMATDLDLTTDIWVPANEPIGVSMDVQAGTSPNVFDATNASASVDPRFFLVDDEANQYKLELSPGVGNGAPELPVWTLLGLGFAGLAMLGSRKGEGVWNPLRKEALHPMRY